MSPPSTADAAAVLLVGHGTRSQRGRSQFLTLAEQVRAGMSLPVEPAFLELAGPTIDEGVERLLSAGIDRLVVAPLLLFAAGHAKDDVPAAVAQALSRCGAAHLPVCQAGHFGCHPLLLELAHRRLTEAIGDRAAVPAERTLLIVVGRGSTDESATAEMHDFANLLAARAGVSNLRVAFLAMAQPLLDSVLAEVDRHVMERVIVQPHLLFHGELVERLHRLTQDAAAEQPGQEWIVTGLLAEESGGQCRGMELLTAATIDVIGRSLSS